MAKNGQKKKDKKGGGIQKPTLQTLAESKTEAAFLGKRDQLLEQAQAELHQLELRREAASAASQEAENRLRELETQRKEQEQALRQLEQNNEAIRQDYQAACATIQQAQEEADRIRASAREQGEQEARDLVEGAQRERLDLLNRSVRDGRELCRQQMEDVESEIRELAQRERRLQGEKQTLLEQQEDMEMEQEVLRETQAHLKALKERYLSCDPVRVEQLQLELNETKTRCETLADRYRQVSDQLAQAQALLDTVQVELQDGGSAVTLQTLVFQLRTLREERDQLQAIYEVYPNSARIAALEEQAQRAQQLEQENMALVQEQSCYRKALAAAQTGQLELEAVQAQKEAIKAINQDLLNQLHQLRNSLQQQIGEPCPVLSAIDREARTPAFLREIQLRRQQPELQSLPELIDHVKHYAGSREEGRRLFYRDRELRAFVAGLSVSRLLILQGMSGTGKSSLPRIFAEAISGFHHLIPVESSWRSRQDLVGYYNELDQRFNATAFTAALYRSGKEGRRSIPTFLVLDEMNLSCMEYYFSDFLSVLQEPDPASWQVSLTERDLRTLPMTLPEHLERRLQQDEPSAFALWSRIQQERQGTASASLSGEETASLVRSLEAIHGLDGVEDLLQGRKLQVPECLWFIGTANRDESTFAITDKVYDRAQVLTLNRKGVAEGPYRQVCAASLSLDTLQQLFDSAIERNPHRQETEARLEELDLLLQDQFDVSFGNRILQQAVDFAGVYTDCGGTLTQALDLQIANKLLRKVWSSEDETAFEVLQEQLQDYPESRQLIQKRLRQFLR